MLGIFLLFSPIDSGRCILEMMESTFRVHEIFKTVPGLCMWIIISILLIQPVEAVLFLNQDSDQLNTTAPVGDLSGSGWEKMGFFGAFSGIPIHRNAFITARHIGGKVGDAFHYQNRTYLTREYHPDPESDLIIWKVGRTFDDIAPLSIENPTLGSELVLFGRGTKKGNPIFSPQNPEDLLGWEWGAYDGRLRWGTNSPAYYLDSNRNRTSPSSTSAAYITCLFDNFENPFECALSRGDSGGGAFSRINGTWQLVGVHYAVSGPYRVSQNSASLSASIFDQRNLFTFNGVQWIQNRAQGNRPDPGFMLITSVSNRIDWIERTLKLIESNQSPFQIFTSEMLGEPFELNSEMNINWAEGHIRLPISNNALFVKKPVLHPYELIGFTHDKENIILHFK